MKTNSPEASHPPQSGQVSRIVLSIFDKVREIKSTHPHIAKTIDKNEKEIRRCLENIKHEITRLDKKDKDLVTILVINGLHRTADEVLID